MRWYTSDTHFYHQRIIELCNRPFKDVNHMNEVLVDNWNSVVKPEDTIYHLGDVALGPKDRWEELFSRLNGYKVLIHGNHDAVSAVNKDNYRVKYAHLYDVFDEDYTNLPGHWLDDGTIVSLSHYPYDGDSHDGDRYKEHRLVDRNRVLIHGHTHLNTKVSRSKRNSLQIHVGVDAWGYRPVSEDEIIDLIDCSRL